MCRIAGKVADELRPHPVCTPCYIRGVMLRQVRAGAAKAGRSLEGFRICMKSLTASGKVQKFRLAQRAIGDLGL